MDNPNITESPQTPTGVCSMPLLGLTVTRIDFNLTRGEDKISTHYSLTLRDGVITSHGQQGHTENELHALALCCAELKTRAEAAEREVRSDCAESNLKREP